MSSGKKRPQFPPKGIILISKLCYLCLLNLAIAARIFELLTTDEQFRGDVQNLSNLTKQADLESCLRLRVLIERQHNIDRDYLYLRDRLEEYIKMTVDKGLIRSNEVNLLMGFWNGKTLLSYWRNQIDFSKMLQKYPASHWCALTFLHISDINLFQDIKEHNRKIDKACVDFFQAKSKEEERQIERLIAFEVIAKTDFRMAIMTLSQMYLSSEFKKISQVNQIWIIHLLKFERMLGVRLNIKNFRLNIKNFFS